jgi:hypothetical protein
MTEFLGMDKIPHCPVNLGGFLRRYEALWRARRGPSLLIPAAELYSHLTAKKSMSARTIRIPTHSVISADEELDAVAGATTRPPKRTYRQQRTRRWGMQ